MAPKGKNADGNRDAPNTSLHQDAQTRRPQKISKKPKSNQVRPTHFLSLPLGHHPELRDRIKEFHQKLLPAGDAATVIEGLDKSILVDPRRLHFTIGIMALTSADPPKSDTPETSQRTVWEAIALLQSLGPEIDAITREPVLLTLDKMGVLKTQRRQAGVLYVGPSDETSEDTLKVARIFDLVGRRFQQEGFIEKDARPAVVHCTLINASHRKPRRIPRTFSYREIFDHASVDANPSIIPEIALAQSQSEGSKPLVPPQPEDKTIRVDFGTWAVSEIQLCKMGSHGPDNEYISVASVRLGAN
ncbi:kinase A anchor protein [Mycena capillaripes]|nr:kinase A anchor protein [Mycena capillaripes]